MTETQAETARRARVARGAWIVIGACVLGLAGYSAIATALWYPSRWGIPVFLAVFGGFMLWNGLTRRLFPARLR